MASVDLETRRTMMVFLGLAALVATIAGWWAARQARLPHLVGAQVVYALGADTEASDQPGLVPLGVRATAYALITFRRGERGALRYLCAHPRVRLKGQPVPVEPLSAWPTSGGILRGLWLTIEPEFPGWAEVRPEDAHRLQYREFLAPDLGRELYAEVEWRAYSDAFLARRLAGMVIPGGAYRLKVRVAAYATEHDLVPTQWVSSAGADDVFSGDVPTVIGEVELPGVDGRRAAPFFRLPCFTFADGVWPEGGPEWPLPLTPAQLLAQRFIVTPEGFASGVVDGNPFGLPWQAPRRLVARGNRFVSAGGEPLTWGREVHAGDALRRAPAYFVLLRDDGDGVLSLADEVAFAWMQPAYVAPLGIALGVETVELELLRVGRESDAP